MQNKNVIIKGLVALAIVAGVAGITQQTKPEVGFSVGVGAPAYGYGYGNCSYVDAAGIVHYYPCNTGYPGIGLGFGWGGWYGGRRYYGHRGGWHRGGHRGWHRGGHRGGRRR